MSAADLPFPFPALKSSQESALGIPWEPGSARRSVGTARMDSPTFVYQLIAYVTKEVLDDASEDYGRSPIGAHLDREPLARYSRSSASMIARPDALSGSPANLRYRVRDDTSLTDLWSGGSGSRGGLSLNPKLGAGRAGLVLMLRW